MPHLTRITLWHTGNPAGDDGVFDLELTSRSGCVARIMVDWATGGVID